MITAAFPNADFWRGKKIFLTGHTGFKGSWLCLWLNSLGAQVTGYALEPPTDPSLFGLARIDELVTSVIADVRDGERLAFEMAKAAPDIVIHMAAQPLVRDSYKIPVETYTTNVMGTVNLLEAVRRTPGVQAVLNVTTDKVYENREWPWGYRENEPFGGYDPYSNSKACSELVTAAYRSSYFNPAEYDRHGVALATARAGNVIGGGDWAGDRLIPDILRSILAGEPVLIRNPQAIRPWQHVLEPLSGYLLLIQKLCEDGSSYAGGWNFGPAEDDVRPVEWLASRICQLWGDQAAYIIDDGKHPHEAHYLKLDCSKARAELGWRPKWNLEKTLESIVAWTRSCLDGSDLRGVCLRQITEYGESE
ncbi:MAG: CDP-glucose 4,6-dehydratase [Geobacter sp.]|nr:CDP-glucose 4,6-dehydratase [Geobacter sp.]